MVPSEYSSGARQRLGSVSKPGNPLLRFLWCEAVTHAVRHDPELKRFSRRKLMQKGLGKAKVAAAGQLGIRLYIMLRDLIDYLEFRRRRPMRQKSGGARAGMPGKLRGPAVPGPAMSMSNELLRENIHRLEASRPLAWRRSKP